MLVHIEGCRSRLCLFDSTPVHSMTLRQLRDSVQNLQLNWVEMKVAETMQPQITEAVDALFHGFGVLASQVCAPMHACMCVYFQAVDVLSALPVSSPGQHPSWMTKGA